MTDTLVICIGLFLNILNLIDEKKKKICNHSEFELFVLLQ